MPVQRLSDARRKVIVQVAADILREKGFDAFTLDEVAARAGCSKTTLYRWWGGKLRLVLDTLSLAPLELRVDSGSLESDLRTFLRKAAEGMHTWSRLFLSVAIALRLDQELSKTWREIGVRPAIVALQAILDRAAARGEIVSASSDILNTVIPASLAWRAAFQWDEDPNSFADNLLEQIVLPHLRR
jgi:AcrR family transcriptional regulator